MAIDGSTIARTQRGPRGCSWWMWIEDEGEGRKGEKSMRTCLHFGQVTISIELVITLFAILKERNRRNTLNVTQIQLD